ncbi:hypothetical protein Chor_011727 [Crotalus horridus]
MASEPPAALPRGTRSSSSSARLTSGPGKRPARPAAPSGSAAAGWPRFWEGQDVLARWTDGLLYLGTIKKVDALRQVCLVQFEDDSQFLVLWKDINPAAVPGQEPTCCVCHSEASGPENRLVRCEKCSHAYHQECHLPRVLSEAAWTCRQCVFAIATKRGGALKKGPYAKAMLGMKLVLPYQLKSLEWDAEHLTNRQQCYCYCGGPGEWNLKMLQCSPCGQWFHEACTQCLSKPLLYGDRVDVAHLILYHLSICCKKKYFDFEREILPFASENWDSLLLGQVHLREGNQEAQRAIWAASASPAPCPPSPRDPQALPPLREQELAQSPPVSPNQGYGGACSSYNFRRTDARCQDSTPIRMFASFHPSANTAGTLRSGEPPLDLCVAATPAAEQQSPERPAPAFLPCPAPPLKRQATPPPLPPTVPPSLCAPASTSYFGVMGRLARGEAVRILARRITTDGTVQYLVEWDGRGMF